MNTAMIIAASAIAFILVTGVMIVVGDSLPPDQQMAYGQLLLNVIAPASFMGAILAGALLIYLNKKVSEGQ